MRLSVMFLAIMVLAFAITGESQADGGGSNGGMTLPPSTAQSFGKTVEDGRPTLTFHGKLEGTFSAGSSGLTAVFNAPTIHTFAFGNTTFTVTIGPYFGDESASGFTGAAMAAARRNLK